MLDFAQCEQLVSTARDRQSKPVANNTRVEKRDADTYALRLHATDIATFHRDGRTTVSSGGWRTVTTAQRLDSFLFSQSRARYSESGVWYVRSEADASDPEPDHGHSLPEIPRPFEALDPGPEPVKPTEGCLAGSQELRTDTRELHIREGERRDDDVTLEHLDGYFSSRVQRDVQVGTHYYEQQPYTYDSTPRQPDIEGAEETKHEQCPHCKPFDAQHRAWEKAMNGGGWGRNRTHGYAMMVELLERYGSRETWHEAYLANFRTRRNARKAHREWGERNRVLFEDDMEITSGGYAKRPNQTAIARDQRAAKRVEKKKRRINKFVADAVAELVTNGLPMPSGGDCWYCSMVTTEGQTWGDLSDASHLDDHIRERYYVPTLFVNALREAGYKDAGIYMFLAMDPEANRMGGPREGFHGVSEDIVTRALRRYLYKRLIPEAYGENKIPPLVGNTR